MNKFNVDLDKLAGDILKTRQACYKLSDVEDRIEKVSYDLVRFRDNADTDQLWKIHETDDGPVIVALYDDSGSLVTESNSEEKDWEAVPNKTAVNLFYKGEHLLSLGSDKLGVPETEFSTLCRWLPSKLSSDTELQKVLLDNLNYNGKRAIAQRFPELKKSAQLPEDNMDFTSPDEYSPFPVEDDVDVLATKLVDELDSAQLQRLIGLLKEGLE